MWINYLKIAWRNLLKYKIFSALNIGGLSIGMAVAILIGTYIQQELRVNQWLPNSDRIHRVYRANQTGSIGGWAYTPSVLSAELNRQFPAIEQTTYLNTQSDQLFSNEDRSFYLDEIAHVDSNFLSLFELPLLVGNPDEALAQPRSIIISETIAKQFFDKTDVIGKTLRYSDEVEVTVTGVYADLNDNTHLDYGMFMRISSSQSSWLNYRFETYVRTVPNTQITTLESQITEHLSPILLREFTKANFEVTESDLPLWRLQALTDIHLYSQGISSIKVSGGHIRYLYTFGFIGLLVLIVVAINYINLSTARAANRAREIGVRKVSGARKKQLIGQFLTESVLQSTIGTLLALPLASLALPLFNEVSGRSLILADSATISQLVLPLLGLGVLLGILAGLYPALVLSGFKTVKVLKGDQKIKVGGKSLRKTLVVVQFMGVAVLTILTTVMYQQVSYMLDQDLGFSADQVMVIPTNSFDTWRKVAARQQDWEKHPGIKAISTASVFPGEYAVDYSLEIEGVEDRYRSPQMIFADANYADVLDLKVKQGRFFSEAIASDTLKGFVINETFAKEYELENPIGTRIRFPWREEWGEVIGIVEDFHYQGLDNQIGPLAFYGGALDRSYTAVRFQADQWEDVQTFINREWPSIEPAHPLRYSLLNEQFAVQYTEYKNLGTTFFYSVCLTIFVAVLGLFGLATFTAQKRTREIGIRKILGANVSELTGLLMRQFLSLSLIASVIATPFAFWLSQRWLTDFAYQTPIGIWPFLLGCLLVVGITLITVGIQSWRAATINPVESLRNE